MNAAFCFGGITLNRRHTDFQSANRSISACPICPYTRFLGVLNRVSTHRRLTVDWESTQNQVKSDAKMTPVYSSMPVCGRPVCYSYCKTENSFCL